MFKNYHVVIFKDREGGFFNLRLRGWLTVTIFAMLIGLSGLTIFLWGYYSKAILLEHELNKAKEIIKGHDSQMLGLTNKLLVVEQDVSRIQQFDAKLRVLMNLGDASSSTSGKADSASGASQYGAVLGNPAILAKHRELFTQYAYSLVDELEAQANLEELDQQKLVNFMHANNDVLLSTPSIWPADGFLSSNFGGRSSPFTGRGQAHKGIDIANRPGTPIWAPARGVVTFAGSDGAYGLSIVIDHGNNVTTRYAHMQKLLVKDGQFVQRGEAIGAMGSSGRSTGPHLHYEVRLGGVPVNPMRYILN